MSLSRAPSISVANVLLRRESQGSSFGAFGGGPPPVERVSLFRDANCFFFSVFKLSHNFFICLDVLWKEIAYHRYKKT